jgi:aspartyl-tRNA(Asn)/glutamyl-tRNA(Gln) amidotransferase subunit A
MRGSAPTLREAQADLAAGTTTVRALVEGSIERIDARRDLNAFLEVFDESALEQAYAIDAKRARGTAGSLAGLVLAIKDNIVYRDHRSSAGSKILGNFQSLFTATALERLLAADAIVIGRTNCDEFAMGSSGENSAFGPTKHPLDPKLVPGGSSAGSAVAVAAGLCHAALGSDTGGSIRQPASLCGVIGLKPTYGRVSRSGLIAYGSSFDQIGPFAHTAEDAARITAVMAGHDPADNTSSTAAVARYDTVTQPISPQRIGVLRPTLELGGLDPEVRANFEHTLERLKSLGHTVTVVDFPFLDYVVPTYYILTTAEASSNLSRFDGIRYGYRAAGATTLEEVYRRSRSEGFGEEVKRRIVLGTFVLSSGYFDAYYTQAMKVRRLLQQHTLRLLEQVDFIVSPTSPTPAFALGEKSDDPIAMYLADIFTVHANLVGCPAISVPSGTTAAGLPLGIHLLSGYFNEPNLLQFAHSLERSAA